MAGRDPDIRLLIGAAMGGVDGDSEQQLRQDIQSIVTKLNRDPVRVFISLKAVGTSGKSLEDQIQAELNKISTTKKYAITINKINADSALKGFADDLKSILKKISLTNVKFEVKDDGVAATVEDIGDEAKKAAKDVAALEAKFNALKDAQKKTKAGWKDVGASLDSDGSVTTQTGEIVNLRQKYIDLNAAIDLLDDNSGMMNDAVLDDLFRQQAEVSELIQLRKQQLVAEKAAANAAVRKANGSSADEEKRANRDYAKRLSLMHQITSALDTARKRQNDWTAAANGGTSVAYDRLKKKIDELDYLLRHLGDDVDGDNAKFKDIVKELDKIYSQIKQADKATKSFGDKFKGLAEKFGSWLTVSQVIMEGIRAIRQMITNVIELDTAMTELRKVTDETEATYNRFLEEANARAKILGATVKDTVTATADFARLGYTIDEAANLADAAMIYKNVGDGIEDISTASESIISTMKAFGIEAENAITIVDRFNITGNNFAISSKGVGDALVRSASALAAANNTLDESIALITAGNATVQDADRVGTTLKTISMFLRAAKTEAEEAGESTEGMANSVSELRAEILALTGNKVDIQIDENTFKSTYQIMKDLSLVWDELTDVSQANLLELIGGKRNSNVVASILQNFETAEEVLAKVGNSAGSAMEENEKYLESVAGHIAQFKATFEGLSSTLIDSETLVKDVVDAGISILEFLTKLAEGLDRVGSLTPIITSLFGAILTFNIGSVTDKVTGLVKAIVGLPATLRDIGIAFKVAHESAASGASAVKRYSDALAAAKVEASLLQVALGAVTAAITLGIMAWSAYQKKLEDARRAADDAAYAANTSIEYIDDQIAEISRLKTELEAESLSEQESYEKRKQLLAIQEELIEAYGHEAAGIDLITASAEGANKALNDLAALQAQHVLDENFAAFDEATAKMQEVKDGWASALGLNTYLGEDIIDRESVDRIYSDLEKIALGLEGVTIYRDDLNDIQNAYIKFGGTARQAEASAEAFGVALRELAQLYKTEGVYDQYVLSGFFPSEEEISDKLGELYENTGKVLDEFAERYDSYIELKIRADVSLVAMEDGLANLSEKYSDIINGASGGGQIAIDQIVAIRSELEAIKNDVSNVEDTGIRDYLLGLIADVEAKMASAPLVEKYVNDVSGFWIKAVRNAIAKFKDATGSVSIYDILNFDVDKGTEEQAAALNYLSMIAREYGVSLEEALRQLSLFGEIDIPVDEVALTRSVETIEELMTKLGGVADEASSLIDAMKTLEDGTAFTTETLMALAEKYPQLLEFSDLFTDKTVESQQAMLDAVLNTYEAEYDAHIDTKIAELKADNEILQKQLDLEEDRLTTVQEIAELAVNSKLDAEEEYQRKLSDLRDQETQNYVEFANGILDIHREMQQGMLDQEADAEEKRYVAASGSGYSVGTAPEWALASASAYEQWLNSVVGSETTINGKSVSAWVSDYTEVTNNRIELLKDTISRNNILIENLEALKGLDLDSIYGGSGGSGSSGSKVEEYVADLEDYYDALKRLSSVQREIETIELNIELSEDTDEKINLTQRLIALYREEGEALGHLTSLRKQTIAAGVEDLRSMGFQVEYNAEINELYISNLERLNELQATNIGKYDSMQEATNALRKDTETLIDSLESLNDANIDSARSVVTLQQNIKDAKASIIEYLDEIVTEANDLVDGFQNAYSVLTDAAKEYASTGYLSVDSLQAILDLGPQYLSMLMTENGQLVVNEQSLQNVIAAKTEQMAAETALSYAKQVLLAVENNEIETLANLTLAATEASGATWNLAYATLGLAKSLGVANGMDESYFDTAISNVGKMQSLTKTATSTISSYYRTLDESYINQKDALQQILEMTQDMIKWENEQQIEALEKEKDAYQTIVDKKKEILKLTKEEEDRDRSITEKLEQIAKLQARIDQLSLDDSREAKAQRVQLEEELHELKKDLADEQSEHALNVQIEALDKQAEANEENIDQQIDALKDMLGSAEKLYQAAISRISNGWDTLYRDLNNWNYNYGNTLSKDLVSAWDQASAAVQRYGSFVAALESVDSYTNLGGMTQTGGSQISGNASSLINQMRQNSIGHLTSTTAQERDAYSAANVQLAAQVGQLLGETLHLKGGYWTRENGQHLYEVSRNEAGMAVVSKMKQNSAMWSAASESVRAQLEAENVELARRLAQYLGVSIVKKSGEWWYGNQKLYDVKKFHTGGIAGGEGTVKQDEVMAILKKGEPVLDEKREQGLYKIIDFTKYLSDKLGKVIDTSAFGRFFGNMPSVFPNVTRPELASSVSESMVFSPVVNVTVQHSGGMTDNEAKRFGSIAADSVLQELSEAFSRRGVSNIGNALLKH